MTSNYYDDPERQHILETGKLLASILIGYGERAFGAIAEMKLSSSAAVILGCYGYQGIIDVSRKKLYDFQRGSAASYGSFSAIYTKVAKNLDLKWVPVENTMSAGSGDDSAVVRLLKEYCVPHAVQDAIDGLHSPEAGIVNIGQTEGEYDASKFAAYFTGVAGALAEGLNAQVNGIGRVVPDAHSRIINPVDWEEVQEVIETVPVDDMKRFAWYRSQLKHPQPTFIPQS